MTGENVNDGAASRRTRVRRDWRRLAWIGLRGFLAAFGVFVLFLLAVLWHVGVFGGNLRTVVRDRFYRSAQLTGSNLWDALRTHHIGTVINLRGAAGDREWYRDEVNECRQLGVTHDDVGLSAGSLPPPIELRKVIHDLDTARYPVLVHCQGGADRSGLVSALYLILYQHEPVDQAENEQLTLRYGHIGYRWNRAHAMDEFFDLYRQTSGGLTMRQWIYESYPRVYQEYHR